MSEQDRSGRRADRGECAAVYDVVVLGCGPAGMSVADLAAVRGGQSVAVVESELRDTGTIAGVAGVPLARPRQARGGDGLRSVAPRAGFDLHGGWTDATRRAALLSARPT